MKMKSKKEKASQKTQGKPVSGATKSSRNEQPMPRTQERGLGTSYAMAVNSLMDQAKEMSGSRNGFLGVEKVTIDPVEHGSCSHVLKKPKAK